MKKVTLLFLLIVFNCQLQAQDFRFRKVSEEEVLQKRYPNEKEANAAVLYRSVRTYYPFKAEVKSYPFFLNYHSVFNCTINILISEGFDVEFLPESAIVQLNYGAGTFKFITAKNENSLKIVTELDI